MLKSRYNLPEPTAIEILKYEHILEDNVAYAKDLLPKWEAVESDSFMILLESQSVKELYLRTYINELVKKMLPHYSSGADLDNFVFGFYGGVKRVENESDEEFLERAVLSVNRFSTAGAIKGYEFYAFKADERVDDVLVRSGGRPLHEYVSEFYQKSEDEILQALNTLMGDGATVEVFIASQEGVDVSSIVEDALNSLEVRPLSDRVVVRMATPKTINIEAKLEIYDMNDKEVIEKRCRDNLTRFYKIGEDVVYSEVIHSLHVSGVYRVTTNLDSDIVVEDTQVAKMNLSFEFIQGVVK